MSRGVVDASPLPPHPLPEQSSPPPSLRARVAVAVAMVGLLVAVRLAGPSIGLGDRARDFVTLGVSVVVESLPFVFLGIVLSTVVRLWVSQRVLLDVLPANPAARRAVLSLLGVLVPVCECGNVPLARGLLARGVKVPEALTFLLAAPILNPITVVTTYQAFGFGHGILLSRVLGGFVVANGVGWLVSRHPDPESLLTPAFQDACAIDEAPPVGRKRWAEAARMFAAETAAMLPALFVGAGVAAAIQVGLSRDLLLSLGQNPVWSVPAMMGLAFVIAICSNVDAFFALSLSSTFLPGSLVAFLVLGAMIDVKMLALLRTTFTVRALATITAVVALSAGVIGLAVNLVTI